MRKLYLILFLLFSYCYTQAQQLHIDWTKFIGGDGSCWAQVRNSIPTSDKGILFTGATNCNDKGDMPPFSLGMSNVFIGKLDSNLQISWIKTYGGTNDDLGMYLSEFPNGDYLLVSRTTSGNGDVIGFHGLSDVWTFRFDAQGSLLWKKCYGGNWSEIPVSAAITAENDLLTLASSTGPGGDVPAHYGNTQFWGDWWLYKTDSSGNIIWSKIFGGTETEGIFGSVLIVDTNYFIVGSSDSKNIDCMDTSWHSSQINTEQDYYVIKLDTAGNKLWSKSYGGTDFDIIGQAIYDHRDSSIIMVGESASNDHMGVGNHGVMDILAIKIDLQGNVKWHKCIGSNDEERFGRISMGPDGGYLLYCQTQFGTGNITNGWISYLDSAGNELSQKMFGSIKNEDIGSIHTYLNGYMATGSTMLTNFTEGSNSGHQGEGPAAFSFFTRLECWPLSEEITEKENVQFVLFPNPSTGKVNVTVPLEVGTLSIVDINGRELVTRKVTDKTGQLTVSTEGWASGFYMVYWRGEDCKTLMQKLVL